MTSPQRILACVLFLVAIVVSHFETVEAQYGVPYGVWNRRAPAYPNGNGAAPYATPPGSAAPGIPSYQYAYPAYRPYPSYPPIYPKPVERSVRRTNDDEPGYSATRRNAAEDRTARPNAKVSSPHPFQEPAWTQEMIKQEDRSHDFKTIAKDSLTEHRFVINNPFVETVHIAKLTSSCSCTTPYLLNNKNEIETYEDAVIVARFNTDSIIGPKSSTITVTIDKPFTATFQLQVRGNVRSDLTITPNSLLRWSVKSFSASEEPAEEKAGATRDVTVTYSGAMPNWQIVNFKSSSKYLSAEVVDVERASSRQKNSKVRITLSPETPDGPFNEHIYFITNDREGYREIPFTVQGVVGESMTVTPVFLGFLQPGETPPTKSATVRGTKPFTITKITSSHPAVVVKFDVNANTVPRPVFAIPVTYEPQEGENAIKDGMLHATVTLETSIPGQNPTFNVTMRVQTESPKDDKDDAEK